MSFGTSLLEARELYSLLQQCNMEFDKVQLKARSQRMELESYRRLLYETLDFMESVGLGKDAQTAIRTMRTLLWVVNMVNIAVRSLMATTPVGALVFLLGTVGSTIAIVDSRRRL